MTLIDDPILHFVFNRSSEIIPPIIDFHYLGIHTVLPSSKNDPATIIYYKYFWFKTVFPGLISFTIYSTVSDQLSDSIVWNAVTYVIPCPALICTFSPAF
jgi:hypothetical protein